MSDEFSSSIKSLSLTLLLLINLLSYPALADIIASNATDKKQALDLHPDVWGYDLSDHKLIPKGYSLFALSYKAPDGDIVFKMRSCIENCDQPGKEKFEYAMFWYFAGKVESAEDTVVYSKKHRLKLYNSEERAELTNGECIKTVHLSTGKLCQVNDLAEDIMIKGQCTILDKPENIYDHNIAANRNPEIKRYSIIGAQSNIYRYIDKPDGSCDRGGPGGGELIYQQLYPIKSVIGLGDGTFLASSSDLIIRFDSNLQTKFISKHNIEMAYDKIIKGNFFVLPYEKIDELSNKVARNNDHGVQGLHDELLLYLYRRAENQ